MQKMSIELRNGVRMPAIGLGTFKMFGNDVVSCVSHGLKSGIRHIDTAAIYKNEELVAEGVKASGLERSEVFLVSKLSPYQQGTLKAGQGCQDMIAKLGGPPVDLALIHWPGVSKTPQDSQDNIAKRVETWRVMEHLYEQGKFRAIGVSNFEVHHLQQLLTVARVPPMVNQVEVHPRRPCKELRSFCAQHGIVVVAYAPLGCGQLLDHPTVTAIASKHGRSPAQVLLAWGLQQGCAVIPKSAQPSRIAEYAELMHKPITLDQEDLAALDALDDGHKYCWDASNIV